MNKNSENAIVNSIGDLHVSMDEMKKSFNFFGEKVLEKLDSIDQNLKEAVDIK